MVATNPVPITEKKHKPTNAYVGEVALQPQGSAAQVRGCGKGLAGQRSFGLDFQLSGRSGVRPLLATHSDPTL